jgi:Putative prokaryotic signal transducing protein
VQIDPDDFKRHYAMLSDAALLEMNRDELVDAARACYDAELAERKLARRDADGEAQPAEEHGQTEGDLQLVGTFLSMEEANFARGLLQSADVPCSLENEFSAGFSGAGALRLLVPASVYDRACEILEAEISEEDLIAQAEAEAEEESPKS